jgi:hypothetical protein
VQENGASDPLANQAADTMLPPSTSLWITLPSGPRVVEVEETPVGRSPDAGLDTLVVEPPERPLPAPAPAAPRRAAEALTEAPLVVVLTLPPPPLAESPAPERAPADRDILPDDQREAGRSEPAVPAPGPEVDSGLRQLERIQPGSHEAAKPSRDRAARREADALRFWWPLLFGVVGALADGGGRSSRHFAEFLIASNRPSEDNSEKPRRRMSGHREEGSPP